MVASGAISTPHPERPSTCYPVQKGRRPRNYGPGVPRGSPAAHQVHRLWLLATMANAGRYGSSCLSWLRCTRGDRRLTTPRAYARVAVAGCQRPDLLQIPEPRPAPEAATVRATSEITQRSKDLHHGLRFVHGCSALMGMGGWHAGHRSGSRSTATISPVCSTYRRCGPFHSRPHAQGRSWPPAPVIPASGRCACPEGAAKSLILSPGCGSLTASPPRGGLAAQAAAGSRGRA